MLFIIGTLRMCRHCPYIQWPYRQQNVDSLSGLDLIITAPRGLPSAGSPKPEPTVSLRTVYWRCRRRHVNVPVCARCGSMLNAASLLSSVDTILSVWANFVLFCFGVRVHACRSGYITPASEFDCRRQNYRCTGDWYYCCTHERQRDCRAWSGCRLSCDRKTTAKRVTVKTTTPTTSAVYHPQMHTS